LGFAAYQIIELPSMLVEVAIAAFILVVAVSNLRDAPASLLHWSLVLVFGLLHGFGFANVLRAVSLTSESFLSTLLAFSVGVAIGQLAFLVCVWLILVPMAGKTGISFVFRCPYRDLLPLSRRVG
jgi:hypothetical protein